MHGSQDRVGRRRWTRAEALRVGAAGGAMMGAGALLGRRGDTEVSAAAPSSDQDTEILAFLLQLEQLQESFYREAARAPGLTGGLRDFVRTVGPQETEHVRFLAERVGDRVRPRLRPDFARAMRSPGTLRRAAIDLEEVTIGAYVGQGMNLTRHAVAAAARIVSVEARQAAWVRDLAGEVPAPRPADPARTPAQVHGALRAWGLIE
jgi:hypothetical protein